MHRPEVGAGIIFGDPDDQPGHHETNDAAIKQFCTGKSHAGQRPEADQVVRHAGNADQRENGGRDHALIERAHDRLAGAEPHEKRADDRGDDAYAADSERVGHHLRHHFRRAAEEDGGQHHGRDRGHRIGLEQIGGHAGAIADIVADIVGDGRRIAWIVLGDSGFDLADQIAADVGALGENAAAQPGEDRDQRGAETERHHGIDDGAVIRRQMQRAGEEAEIKRHAKERQPGHQEPGDGAGAEGELKPAGERTDGGLRGAHIGAHGNVHANKAGRTREDRSDGKADRDQPAEENTDDHEDHDADDGDGGVLPPQIGLCAFADRSSNLLHLFVAGIGRKHGSSGPDGVNDRQNATENDEPQRRHEGTPVDGGQRLTRPGRRGSARPA